MPGLYRMLLVVATFLGLSSLSLAQDYVTVCKDGQCQLVRVNVSARDIGVKLATSVKSTVARPALLRLETLYDGDGDCHTCRNVSHVYVEPPQPYVLNAVPVTQNVAVPVYTLQEQRLPIVRRVLPNFARRVFSRLFFWR